MLIQCLRVALHRTTYYSLYVYVARTVAYVFKVYLLVSDTRANVHVNTFKKQCD